MTARLLAALAVSFALLGYSAVHHARIALPPSQGVGR